MSQESLRDPIRFWILSHHTFKRVWDPMSGKHNGVHGEETSYHRTERDGIAKAEELMKKNNETFTMIDSGHTENGWTMWEGDDYSSLELHEHVID